jgi:hypothetical protein
MSTVINFPRKHLRNGDETTDYGRRWNLSMLLILFYGEWIEAQLRGEFREPPDAVSQDAAAAAHAILMLSEMSPDRVAKLYAEADAMPCVSYAERRQVMQHIMREVLAYVEEMD